MNATTTGLPFACWHKGQTTLDIDFNSPGVEKLAAMQLSLKSPINAGEKVVINQVTFTFRLPDDCLVSTDVDLTTPAANLRLAIQRHEAFRDLFTVFNPTTDVVMLTAKGQGPRYLLADGQLPASDALAQNAVFTAPEARNSLLPYGQGDIVFVWELRPSLGFITFNSAAPPMFSGTLRKPASVNGLVCLAIKEIAHQFPLTVPPLADGNQWVADPAMELCIWAYWQGRVIHYWHLPEQRTLLMPSVQQMDPLELVLTPGSPKRFWPGNLTRLIVRGQPLWLSAVVASNDILSQGVPLEWQVTIGDQLGNCQILTVPFTLDHATGLYQLILPDSVWSNYSYMTWVSVNLFYVNGSPACGPAPVHFDVVEKESGYQSFIGVGQDVVPFVLDLLLTPDGSYQSTWLPIEAKFQLTALMEQKHGFKLASMLLNPSVAYSQVQQLSFITDTSKSWCRAIITLK